MSTRVTKRIAQREAKLKARTNPKPTYPEEVAQAAAESEIVPSAPAAKPKRTKKN